MFVCFNAEMLIAINLHFPLTLTTARQLNRRVISSIYFLNPLKSNLHNDCSFGQGLDMPYDRAVGS